MINKKALKAFEIMCRAAFLIEAGDRFKVFQAVWKIVKPQDPLPNKKRRNK